MNPWSRLLVFVALFLVAGCGSVAVTPQSTYLLGDLKAGGSLGASKTRLTLLVANPTANSGYQTAGMLYMISPYELKSFTNNRWVAPPAQMLLPMLVNALRKTGYFYAVVAPPFSGNTHYLLDTQLIKLQQEFLLPTSQVRLAVQATLISNANNRVVATRLFETVVLAPANNPYSGVLAANRAAAIISQRIARFCVHYAR